jgi:WD40 repeat protein/serine/threonine protein kinase
MTTLAELLATLRRLHLLEPAQLDLLSRQWAEQNVDPRAAAKQLVEQGLLTHFQANQLFKGKGNELLLGSYVLLELLGEGGMGTVYKARNWKLGQVVALKLIRRERLTNPAAVRRFEREIRACAQLAHPNIVRARDADEVNGTHLLVMEYVAGGQDLHKLVREHGRLPIEQACRFVQQAAMGLQHAFERGLVHRDIKPHNLILSGVTSYSSLTKTSQATRQGLMTKDEGLVKILDFGLARLGEGDDDSSTLTQEGSVMGTMDYLAPEQARDSHTADIRSDLYSLGCTMYFLLTGQAPFSGGTAAEKMYKHQFSEPTPLQGLRPETPNAVADIVNKLMAKRPEDRYQAPAELALDLEAFLAGRPVSASATASSRVRTVGASDTSQALQETYNPFADLSHSKTAADEPLASPIATAKLPATKMRTGNRHRLMVMAAGGAAALVVVIATVVVVFGHKPPPIANESAIVHSKTPKKPTAIDLTALAEKWRQEEEATEKKRKAEEDAARQKWIAEDEEIRKKRAAEAEGPFKLLEAKFKEKDVTFPSLAKAVAAFKAKHGGTPLAIRAAEMLMNLPSPFGQLDPQKLPQDCIDHWRAAGREPPVELVGVLGEHRQRHWAGVSCLAYSPDGKEIASGSHDNTVRIWDAATLREKSAIAASGGQVLWLAYSPNGKQLVSGGHEHFAPVWDAGSGKLLRRLEGHGTTVWSVAVSANGRHVLTGSSPLMRLWELETGTMLRSFEGHKEHVMSVAFAPDGLHGLSGGRDGTVRLWNLETGKEVRRFEGLESYVEFVAFVRDGRSLVANGTIKGAFKTIIWDAASGEVIREIESARYCCLSQDGQRLLTAGRLWNVDDGAAKEGPKFPDGPARFSPDGKRIVAGHADGTVRLWDVETGKEVQPLTGPVGPLRSIAFAPDDGLIVAGGSDGLVHLWDPNKGPESRPLKGHTGIVYSVCFSPDGRRILSASGDRTIRLWTTDSGETLFKESCGDTIHGVAWSPQGRLALTAGQIGHVLPLHLWDLEATQKLRPLEGHTGHVIAVAFSPDGDLAASASHDNSVRIWNVETGKEMHRWQAGIPLTVPFSPDGRTVYAAGEDGQVKAWQLARAASEPTFVLGKDGKLARLYALAVGPDGRQFVTTGQVGQVLLWDSSGQKLREWQLPGPVHGLAFAADGRHLATANGNGTVYIFRLRDELLPPRALTAADY